MTPTITVLECTHSLYPDPDAFDSVPLFQKGEWYPVKEDRGTYFVVEATTYADGEQWGFFDISVNKDPDSLGVTLDTYFIERTYGIRAD